VARVETKRASPLQEMLVRVLLPARRDARKQFAPRFLVLLQIGIYTARMWVSYAAMVSVPWNGNTR
jgi:hypothetical protein